MLTMPETNSIKCLRIDKSLFRLASLCVFSLLSYILYLQNTECFDLFVFMHLTTIKMKIRYKLVLKKPPQRWLWRVYLY